MSTLSQYLASHKKRYLTDIENGKGHDWTVVMGNEAGDLDSIASSIAYSWVRTEVHQQLSIPFILTKRSDFSLRAENTLALSLSGIKDNLEEILCRDDLHCDQPFPSCNLALVDHNSLSPDFSSHDARVVATIDHHDDEQKYKDTADPRIIRPAGSCSSLVTQLCPPHLPPDLANLLLCALLVDTSGLKPGGKALDVDRDAAVFLVKRSTLIPSNIDTIQPENLINIPELLELSSTLSTTKNSVSHLGTRDLLRRDYKEYRFVLQWIQSKPTVQAGLSTVPLSFEEWFSRERIFPSTKAWMEERNITVLGIMTTFRQKSEKSGKLKHRREGMLVIRDDGSQDPTAEKLASRVWTGFEAAPELQLKPVAFEDFGVEHAMLDPSLLARLYKQKNADATRKTTAPLLRQILEGTVPAL